MQPRERFTYVAVVVAILAAAVAAAQQPDPLTDFERRGHVFEPQAISPTDARVAQLSLPPGFQIQRFAEGLENPRMIDVADEGTIYVTQRRPGNLVMLRDLDRDGVVDVQKVVLEIPQLHGIEIRGRRIWLADVKNVYSGDLMPDGSVANVAPVTRGLPDGGQHPNRTIGLGPDGELYVSVGSTCNACDESDPESATMLRMSPGGGPREIFASGLRNTIGFAWHPGTGKLHGLDNGIDWLGNEEQSEELNLIEKGKAYGWPYVYDRDRFNPQDEPPHVTQLAWARQSEEPIGGHTAHAAPMQFLFYEGSQFPRQYQGHGFAAMRGSWNRKPASGYEVVRLKFAGNGDFEGFEPFLGGFLQPQPERAPPWPGAQPKPAVGYIGRPVGLAVAQDGALIVGDDSNNVLYRVGHGPARGTPPAQRLARAVVGQANDSALRVGSSAFGNGARIPVRFTDYGAGVSPPITWGEVPAGTRSIVLMMEDPDAVSPLPFVHWLAANVDPQARALPAGIAPVEWPKVAGAQQGSNSLSRLGYFGPRPPAGDTLHRYHVQVFALDTRLDLPSGYNRHTLLRAMRGHVLGHGEVVGTFSKEP